MKSAGETLKLTANNDNEWLCIRRVDIVDVKDTAGWTSLHYAAHHGQLDCTQYLLEEGDANMHAKNKAGLTAADLAIKADYGEVTSFLNGRNRHLRNTYEIDS